MYSRLYQFARNNVLSGHQYIRRYLHELEISQWLSPSELEAFQLKRIQDLVAYAYEHVPFYRERYKHEGLCPQDIKTLENFRSVPILTRDDVQLRQRDLVSKAFQGDFFYGSTSGSTGNPMRYIMEKSTAYWSYAAEARCRAWHGVYPGDKMARFLVLLGNGSKGDWKSRLANLLKRYRWLDPRNLNKSTMKAFADVLVKWHPVMLRAYPSALTIFASFLKEHNIHDINPKFIESTGEKVTPSQRQLFWEVFKAPTIDHYSSLEIFSIAYECPRGSLHVLEDRYLELFENGNNVAPGKTGDITVTSLNQYAMPFIRYQNGDVGSYASNVCSCGRGMPVLHEMGGRKSDVFMRPDGQPVHWTGVYVVMMPKHNVYQYQMYQPDRCHLDVRLVCKQNIDKAYLDDIRKELQPLFGDTMQISVKIVDHIPSSKSGKRLFLISDANSDIS